VDNERIRNFVKQGVSIMRAAAALKRTTLSVRTQARKIGSPFPTTREAQKKFANDPQATWHLAGSCRRRSHPGGDLK
jgi:hypothetical protein